MGVSFKTLNEDYFLLFGGLYFLLVSFIVVPLISFILIIIFFPPFSTSYSLMADILALISGFIFIAIAIYRTPIILYLKINDKSIILKQFLKIIIIDIREIRNFILNEPIPEKKKKKKYRDWWNERMVGGFFKVRLVDNREIDLSWIDIPYLRTMILEKYNKPVEYIEEKPTQIKW